MVVYFPIYSAYGVYILAKAVWIFAEIFPRVKIIAALITIDTVLFVSGGIYCGIGLYKVRKNALQFTKWFLILFLLVSVMNPLLVFISDLPKKITNVLLIKMPKYIAQRVGFFIIWYLYFTKSKRVSEIYTEADV